jgi:hypothetical protein
VVIRTGGGAYAEVGVNRKTGTVLTQTGAGQHNRQFGGGIRRCFMSAGGAAAAGMIRAIGASGVVVRVEPDDFVGLVKRQPAALVVHATGGFFSTDYRYLTSYKGLAFYQGPRTVGPASGHGVGPGQEDLGAGRVAPMFGGRKGR